MIKAIFFDYHGVVDKRTFKGLLTKWAELTFKPESGQNLETHTEYIINKHSELGIDYASGKVSPKEFWSGLEYSGLTKPAIEELKNYILNIESDYDLLNYILELRKDFYTGLLSDCPKDKAEIILKNIDLGKYFESIFFSYEYKYLSKKSEKFFNLTLLDSRFTPDEVLFVDDSANNIEFAAELGFNTHEYKNLEEFKEYIKTIINK
jgi:FMN phosphatase YigB (HAD superfamily)